VKKSERIILQFRFYAVHSVDTVIISKVWKKKNMIRIGVNYYASKSEQFNRREPNLPTMKHTIFPRTQAGLSWLKLQEIKAQYPTWIVKNYKIYKKMNKAK